MAGFRQRVPALVDIAMIAHLNVKTLAYVDYCYTISEWLKINART